ncbi:adenylate cyclase type 10-like isoform X2 [Apis cerana]|uniref:adenylate cyclase type 10-like isoform X2 n=1 Tax=Apis cerana TaxID=7461 RepID=UPI002B22217B|nr:adenylate cyclase type 10-like isoform X2 [Apis cerana]
MRVQFPKSNTYCEETDWQRYKKMIDIFEKILNEIIGYVCILLDDVHYMDPFSWQFLSAILSNKHIVLVMTMLEPVSWDTLTQIETGISQEKRLKIKSLNSLNAEYLAAFACQFLNVIAIPETLERILSQHSKNGIGWCEAFLMSILQVKALDIISISPQEVQKYNLVFPDPSFLSKIPVYLTPEELAPPLQWMQMTTLNVCVPSKKPKTVIEANRDVIGLRIDIYNRMNSYEQDFIKCAAALGDIFHRNILSNVISNSTPLYTSKGKYRLLKKKLIIILCITVYSFILAVAEMIRLRILECAMVQRKYYINMTTYHAFKKRKTFSNMHHLVFCDCIRTRPIIKETLPVYADCRVLEFTISSYRKFFYDILSLQEKNEYHTKAINILEQSAKKCSSCGRGPFLIPLIEKEEKLEENMHRDYIHKISERFERRRSIFVTKDEIRKDKPNARIASVVPTIFTEDNMEEFLPRETKEESLVIPKKVEVNSFGITYDSLEEIMKSFTFMDNRSCTCMEIISYIFWQISQHIYQIKDIQPEMFIKFTMEYSAGLIQTGQSLHAIKFLMNINEDINEKNREKNQFENIFIKEQWLILIGKKSTRIYIFSAYNKRIDHFKLKYRRTLVVQRGRLHRVWKLFRSEEILYRGCDIEDRDPAKYENDLL